LAFAGVGDLSVGALLSKASLDFFLEVGIRAVERGAGDSGLLSEGADVASRRDLAVRWLIVEWPTDQAEPTRYWFSDLPSTTPEPILVRLAKLRWRIEHDYRELKDGLGLDHYEGRTWAGWHHHVTLVSAAHGFLTLQRLDPKAPAPA
jgi:SRSO17 transposase